MAKKKKSASKAPVARAFLLNLDAGTVKGDTLRAVLDAQGIAARDIRPEQLGDPVGAVARLVGFRPSLAPYVGEVPECEFMLLCDVGNKQMDKLLAAMREADCIVDRKCVLTKYNKTWPLIDLVKQVDVEHTQNANTAAS